MGIGTCSGRPGSNVTFFFFMKVEEHFLSPFIFYLHCLNQNQTEVVWDHQGPKGQDEIEGALEGKKKIRKEKKKDWGGNE